jgi:ParB family transcriptional regulator, chromosome partitioning protein
MSGIKKAKGLGRGLDILLGGDPSQSSQLMQLGKQEEAIHALPLASLQAGKYQPRTRMDETSLNELAASIRAQGLIQPILVRPVAEGKYEIIAGERRFRAAGIAGLQDVPVVVKTVSDEAALAMALIENIQREDLNPLEEAQGLQRLINEFGMTHEQVSQAIGRSRSATSNLLRLLNLAKPVQTMLVAGDIDMGHARALLALEAAQQITIGNQVVNKRLSVREAEKLVAETLAINTGKKAPNLRREADADTLRLAEELSDMIGATVKIKPGKKGAGTLSIEYADLDQLDGVLARLKGEAVVM